jgi:hypothetical protein
MAQSRMHQQPEGYPLSIATHSFPSQRDQATASAQDHDHAWRQVEDPDQPLAMGMYRCDLCQVVWAL